MVPLGKWRDCRWGEIGGLWIGVGFQVRTLPSNAHPGRCPLDGERAWPCQKLGMDWRALKGMAAFPRFRPGTAPIGRERFMLSPRPAGSVSRRLMHPRGGDRGTLGECGVAGCGVALMVCPRAGMDGGEVIPLLRRCVGRRARR